MSSKLKIGDIVQWKPSDGYKSEPEYGVIRKICQFDYNDHLTCDVYWYKQKSIHSYLSNRLIYIAPKYSNMLKLVGVCR